MTCRSRRRAVEAVIHLLDKLDLGPEMAIRIALTVLKETVCFDDGAAANGKRCIRQELRGGNIKNQFVRNEGQSIGKGQSAFIPRHRAKAGSDQLGKLGLVEPTASTAGFEPNSIGI